MQFIAQVIQSPGVVVTFHLAGGDLMACWAGFQQSTYHHHHFRLFTMCLPRLQPFIITMQQQFMVILSWVFPFRTTRSQRQQIWSIAIMRKKLHLFKFSQMTLVHVILFGLLIIRCLAYHAAGWKSCSISMFLIFHGTKLYPSIIEPAGWGAWIIEQQLQKHCYSAWYNEGLEFVFGPGKLGPFISCIYDFVINLVYNLLGKFDLCLRVCLIFIFLENLLPG